MTAQLLLVWFHPRALEAVQFDLTPITQCFYSERRLRCAHLNSKNATLSPLFTCSQKLPCIGDLCKVILKIEYVGKKKMLKISNRGLLTVAFSLSYTLI